MNLKFYLFSTFPQSLIYIFYGLTFIAVIVEIVYQAFIFLHTSTSFWLSLFKNKLAKESTFTFIISLIIFCELAYYYFSTLRNQKTDSKKVLLIFLTIILLLYRGIYYPVSVTWETCREYEENITYNIIVGKNGFHFNQLPSTLNCPDMDVCLDSVAEYIEKICFVSRKNSIIFASFPFVFFLLHMISSFIIKISN